MPGALSHIRVLDLSRVLAGPWAGQILADLGAEVIKIERPGSGDDTRAWGPPFLKDAEGNDTSEAAYYLSANRNKKSVTVDFTQPEGQRIVRELAAKADILLENFKVGGLKAYGLDYESLKQVNPKLIYCSITGFGQSGPYAKRAGYDFMIQGLGGLMSLTGRADNEEGAGPVKVGVALTDGGSDIMLFASNGKAVRFDESEVRSMGRTATGVRGMRLVAGADADVEGDQDDGEAGDADDAAFGLQQMRQRVMGAVHRAHVVDLHDAFENGDILDIGKLGPHGHAGVAHQRVDAAEFGNGGVQMVVESDVFATAAFADHRKDELYLALASDGHLYKWDAAITATTQVWRSKLFHLDRPQNIGAVKIEADTYPVTFRLYGDGSLADTVTVNSEYPTTLRGDLRYREVFMEIECASRVDSVTLASSILDMRHGQ